MAKCTDCGKEFTPDCAQEEICQACQAEGVPEASMTVADDYDDDYDREFDEEEDEWEEAVQECGLLPPHLGGGCTLGGTEHCDFECPFRDHPEWLIGETDDEESQDGEATETGRMEGI